MEGRLTIPELELEVGLVERWVRFWFRGELIALPDELHHQVDHYRRQLQIAETALRERDREIEGLDEQIQERDQQLNAVLVAFRPLVEVKARTAGRQDLLDQLPAADTAQQSRWLVELP